MFDYYSFNDFYLSDTRRKYDAFNGESDSLLKIAELLFDKSNATLRQQEKMFALTRLVLSSFESNQYTFSDILFVLVYIKTMKNQLYEKIKHNNYQLQELYDIFKELFFPDGINLFYMIARLLYLYNNNQDYENKKQLFDTDAEGKRICLIKFNFDNESERKNLTDSFGYIEKRWDVRDIELNYLLNKIDLIEPINKL